MRVRVAGSPAGSWRRSSAWTTYVPLTTWFTKYGGPTEHKWSNRTQVVQAERPRHDMRDTAPPCGTIGERNGVGRRNRPSSDAVGPFLAEMSAPLSRAAVGTAFSRAKYTPDARRRPGPDTATREDEPLVDVLVGPPGRSGCRRGRRPARGAPPGARSGAGCPNLLQKARVEPRCTRKKR